MLEIRELIIKYHILTIGLTILLIKYQSSMEYIRTYLFDSRRLHVELANWLFPVAVRRTVFD